MKEELLRLTHVTKEFTLGRGKRLTAVDDVSLEINMGETLGIVGESGCGKSTLARLIMGVYKPTQGEIFFQGNLLSTVRQKDRIAYGKKAQMIFQDPYTSLNPYMTAADIIGENLEIHGIGDKKQRRERISELLELVGLGKEHSLRFPHEFSGGQRQRIGIARALAAEPSFLVCDEPISALDVSIQSQIMNLLKQLSEELGLTYLFIAHDLHMVRYISKVVGVMYQGRIVELADADEIWNNPLHPYTQKLMEAVLTPKPSQGKLWQKGMQEKLLQQPPSSFKGCRFREQCRFALPCCSCEEPEMKEGKLEHFVSCFLFN